MKSSGIPRPWMMGTTVVFGLAQLWAAYELSTRLHGYIPALGEEWRWLIVGAALLLVAGQWLAAMSSLKER